MSTRHPSRWIGIDGETLSRNLAAVIDDLYREHAAPRDHDRIIDLVQVQVKHAMEEAVKAARRGWW